MSIKDLIKLKVALLNCLNKTVYATDFEVLDKHNLITIINEGGTVQILYPNNKDIKDILNKINKVLGE